MPRELDGWLKEVVEAAEKRKAIIKRRERPHYDLKESILNKKGKGLNPIIAEYKTRSPSGFAQYRDPIQYAKFMEASGAAALSVITEPLFFFGNYEVFEAISSSVNLPVLFKDFVVSEKQIDTAYSLGADAVLLIVRILKEDELCRLYERIKSYRMRPVVEVFDKNDLEVAKTCDPEIIGVNARDLFSLDVSIDRVVALIKELPDKAIKLAESGIKERSDIIKLKEAGADAFLIGSSLMKDPNKIKDLI